MVIPRVVKAVSSNLHPYRVPTDNGDFVLMLSEDTQREQFPTAQRVKPGLVESKDSPNRSARPRGRKRSTKKDDE